MAEELAVPEPALGVAKPPVLGPSDEVIMQFQGQIEGLLTPALRTLHELCEMADSEGVRLGAAINIITLAGLRPNRRRYAPVDAEVDKEEGTARELALMLEKLEKNRPGIIAAVSEAARDEVAKHQVVDAEVVEDDHTE